MPQDMPGVMREFKEGKLHSGGSGKVVTNRKQAIAIGLSEQRKLRGGGRKAPRLGGKR